MLPLTARVAPRSFGTSDPDPVCTCRAKGEDVGCFLVPNGGQPTACTLALWWLKLGPTECRGGGGGGFDSACWGALRPGHLPGVPPVQQCPLLPKDCTEEHQGVCAAVPMSSLVLPIPGFVGGSFPCLAHHTFLHNASGAPVVAHWVPDPVGAGEQGCCAAGAAWLALCPPPPRTEPCPPPSAPPPGSIKMRKHGVAWFGQARDCARYIPQNTRCRQRPTLPLKTRQERACVLICNPWGHHALVHDHLGSYTMRMHRSPWTQNSRRHKTRRACTPGM